MAAAFRAYPFQIAALALAIVGFIVSWIALLTPAWQVVYAREIQQWIESGLWMNCQTRPSNMLQCTYTFSESDFDFYTNAEMINWRTPPFYAWQRRLLFVFIAAQMLAFLCGAAFCCSFHPPTARLSAVSFILLIGVAFLMHAGASLMFVVCTQLVEYRFYHVSVSGIYEKHWGYSFFVELAATACYLISLLCAIVHLLHTRLANKNPSNQLNYYGGQLDDYETQLAMRRLPTAPPLKRHEYYR